MKIVYSTAAKADLKAIGQWIAEANPARARSFVEELVSACELLAEFPDSSPLFSNRAGKLLRRKVHGNYLIFYRVEKSTLGIARILHGAQDYSDLF